ncbi:B12-binding domain-containing radical SAM protein [Anaerosporobacter faecicola]|uniref:B12-binding domain-containing radical SAM protein n=1 Tax=Anaerosporobacter faecicola TaxID=2718714 RepID=UPI001EE5AC23|nr:radical SAM protein [Anaerosporobacter faecicola]
MSIKKKTKILLLSVLTEKNAIITEEIGMCSIAAFLEQDGFDVALVNSTRSYLDFNKIYKDKPDLIGVSMYSTTETVVYETCKTIKENLPDVKISIGGYWPTLYGKKLLEKYSIYDYAICGEGELAFRDLANAIEYNTSLSTVGSLIYHDKGEIIENKRQDLIEDLDSLPFPRRDLLLNNKLKYAYISTSRGCMASCSFCWHQNFWGTKANNRWRGRSPQSVVAEVKEIVNKYGVNRFWFIDDSFEDSKAGNTNRMWDIAQLIIDEGLHITYETYFRSEVHKRFNPEKMKLIKESGLVGIVFGTESGNEEDLKLYNKPASVTDNLKAIEYFRENDIAVDIGFINFNPYSTFENLRKNIDFLEKTKFASVLYYIVERCGITEFSSLYYKLKKDGLLIEEQDLGCYSYHYVNEDIGKLSKFLYYKYHENENSKVYFYAKKIGSIIREEFKIINYLKRSFGQMNDTITRIIAENEERAWEYLERVNHSNAQCFRELLDMTEKGFDQVCAESITEKYLNLEYIKGISDLLEKNRLGLYMRLKNEGVPPELYLNIE